MLNHKVTNRKPTTLLPTRASGRAISYNLYSEKLETIKPYESKELGTGITLERNDQISSVLFVLGEVPSVENNKVETLEEFISYGNEIKVKKINYSAIENKYSKDSVIGQVVSLKCYSGLLTEVDNLDDTHRGSNGFGSTGTQ